MKRFLTVLFLLFLAPAAASIAFWWLMDRPQSWRSADWSSAGILPSAAEEKDAVIHVMAARTGGLKGALSLHSWLVVKRKGQGSYDRYDVVGWGMPVRRNGYPADGRWYSNVPGVVATVRGEEAERLIPLVEQAIASYPHAGRGGYRLWPGPNSNSFVGHVLREVPEIGAVLPPNAVGRDFLAGYGFIHVAPDWRDVQVSLFGLAGMAAGFRSGLEINFMGLVAGLDIANPAVKLPGFGRIGLAD